MENLTKEQKEKFTKLGISSIAELALIVPTAYEDYRLYDTIMPHAQVIDATLESLYRGPNSIQITFFVHNFGHALQVFFFVLSLT